MQSVSSRIRTRVAVSISYDDNDYTTGQLGLIDTHVFIFFLSLFCFRLVDRDEFNQMQRELKQLKKNMEIEHKEIETCLSDWNCPDRRTPQLWDVGGY